MKKELKPIIDSFEQIIREGCTDKNYSRYVKNCLIFKKAGACMYDITEQQFEYCMNRALIRF